MQMGPSPTDRRCRTVLFVPGGLGRCDLLVATGRVHRDVSKQRVTLYPDQVTSTVLGHGGDTVVQVVIPGATGQLDLGTWPNEDIDIAADRIRVDVDLCRRTPGSRQIDCHVSED